MNRDQFDKWLLDEASTADLYASLCFLRDALRDAEAVPIAEGITGEAQQKNNARMETVRQEIWTELRDRMQILMEVSDPNR